MGDRQAARAERTRQLIGSFTQYLDVFERHTPFTRAGQWEHHVRTIQLRRSCGSAVDAIATTEFVDSLRDTLNAWGIGVRGSKLADRERFVEELAKRVDAIAKLEGVRIAGADDAHRREVWMLVQSLDIVDNEARIVALTKTLHHLLPDLVMPIDRAYTGAFLDRRVQDFQNRQQEIFESGWELAREVARAVNVDQYVGTGPWHTSVTKVIDNAIVGYCIAEGLVTPARGGSRGAPRPAKATMPRGDVWTLAELELELEAFAAALEEAGLRENSINTYVGRAETFLRWLAGTYQPQGPRPQNGEVDMPEPMSDKSLTREERIKWARAQAAENLPEKLERQQKERENSAEWVRAQRPEEIRETARKLRTDRKIPSIGPVKNPDAWANARRACREYVIDAVRAGRLVNYDELRVLTFETTGMTLGFRMFPRMCEEINEDSDGCLLSSWVVTQATGRPGNGFFDLARAKGYDFPLETLQRQVREHFAI